MAPVMPIQVSDAAIYGALFHRVLTEQLGEASHPDDPTHDLAVGTALVSFRNGVAPTEIVATYNQWAVTHGYARIQYLGLDLDRPGCHLVDIQTVVLSIDPQGGFLVVPPPNTPVTADGLLRVRLLPPEEWDAKLVGTSLEHKRPHPQFGLILVVERDDQVVACWAAITTVHLEGLWIAPADRGSAGVGRALLSGMLAQLKQHHVTEVLTNAETPEIAAMIEKAGGTQLPGHTWVLALPAGEES